jgi:hypothetical protein
VQPSLLSLRPCEAKLAPQLERPMIWAVTSWEPDEVQFEWPKHSIPWKRFAVTWMSSSMSGPGDCEQAVDTRVLCVAP